MVEPTKIDQLSHHFRMLAPLFLEKIEYHLVGKVLFFESPTHTYLAQIYESIHTKSQIQTDLELLRSFSNHGFDVPVPLISKDGTSIETQIFLRPCAVFSRQRQDFLPLSTTDISRMSTQLAEMEKIAAQKHPHPRGKKIDALFTMFELLFQEEEEVEETLISEYFAFKSAYIELLNSTQESCLGFFPGSDRFYLSKEGSLGFTHRSFVYDHPRLFGFAQFILSTCFNDDGSMNYEKLDSATSSYAIESSLAASVWELFDLTLKTAAFFEVLCHWLATVYQPHLKHIDELIAARMKQKHLKTLKLKEIR